jgi:hypothetical protein
MQIWKWLIANVCGLALCGSAHANVSLSLLDTVDGQWAIDGACGVPAKTYIASVNPQYQIITWQDGLGNTDVENILYSSPNEFRTMTTTSVHQRGGNAYGTGWVYHAVRGDYAVMRITKLGRTFFASRCD